MRLNVIQLKHFKLFNDF